MFWRPSMPMLLDFSLNFCAIFGTAGREESRTYFSIERYLDLITVKAEKVVSLKYVVLNGRRIFNAIQKFRVIQFWLRSRIQSSIFVETQFLNQSLDSSVNSSWTLYGRWLIPLMSIKYGLQKMEYIKLKINKLLWLMFPYKLFLRTLPPPHK